MLRQLMAIASVVALLAITARAGDRIEPRDAQHGWFAAGYRFSDERGGFRITGISGSGRRDDPVVISQEIHSVEPCVITIRFAAANMLGSFTTGSLNGLHLRLETANATGTGWIGFEVELQEQPGQRSTHGDGLSVDQMLKRPDRIFSDRFANHEIEYEPGDTLIYQEGVLDDPNSATFAFYMIDLTPVPVFYISQRPRLPAS